jgi:hypothetical protein
VIGDGQLGATEVTVGGGAVTVIVADPDTVVYPASVEFAVHDPLPTLVEVNTPACVMVPPVEDQVTA